MSNSTPKARTHFAHIKPKSPEWTKRWAQTLGRALRAMGHKDAIELMKSQYLY